MKKQRWGKKREKLKFDPAVSSIQPDQLLHDNILLKEPSRRDRHDLILISKSSS